MKVKHRATVQGQEGLVLQFELDQRTTLLRRSDRYGRDAGNPRIVEHRHVELGRFRCESVEPEARPDLGLLSQTLLYHIAEAEMGWLWWELKGHSGVPPAVEWDFPFEPIDAETG